MGNFKPFFLSVLGIVSWPLFVEGSGLNTSALQSAAAYSASHRGVAFLVVQNGRVLLEDYPDHRWKDPIAPIFSGTKGFWCVTAAIAVQDKLLDFNEPVSQTVSEWNGRKTQIRIRDLLNFTAGIEPAFALHGRSIPDRNRYSLQLPSVRDRGQSFIYGPSQLQIFSEVLRRKLMPKHLTPKQYISTRLLTPLGVHHVEFREDAVGNPLLASGFRLEARQWAMLGKLILGKGRIAGNQIVKPQFLDTLFQGTRANPIFGMGFWLNQTALDPSVREVDIERMLELPWERQNWQNSCICREAPSDMIASIGSGYQRMFIIPSMSLIIVRQGQDDPSFSDARFLRMVLAR
ncbi:MAG: beta-lactamase family protein [Verrucomicrobia bacterium]|nr:beta-lactamase family protein [Verrucomicrobiota bacterium]